MNAVNDGKPVTVAGFDGPYWEAKERSKQDKDRTKKALQEEEGRSTAELVMSQRPIDSSANERPDES